MATASNVLKSLFTNVQINETLDKILECVYGHVEIPKPIILAPILKKLLLLCTTKSTFRNHDGALFLQVDGVSMGSPLGPTFANYHMGSPRKEKGFESFRSNWKCTAAMLIAPSCASKTLKKFMRSNVTLKHIHRFTSLLNYS